LTAVSTNFNNPIGIDYHPLSNKVLVSVNYPSGTPDNFELVASDGTRTQFSSVSGLTDEVKIATVRSSSCQGGFNAGELFVGTGTAGVIARISPDGSTVRNPWVTLSGETGLMRGGLFQDRFCAFGGDLIAVPTTGNVWRVNSAGTATRLATGVGGGAFLEGVTTVPNNSALYGPWAGKILTPAELQNLLYTVDAQGTVQSWNLGITLPEEVRVITANENFFGVDFSNRVVWGAGADQFASIVGDIVIPEETSTGRLWQVHWNAATSSFQTTVLAQVGQWEQITFAPAGVNPITSTLPTEPAPPFTALPGLPGTGATPDPVLTNAGSYAYSHTDLAIPGRGSSPAFARAYNGTDTRIGPLGPAWTHNYNIRLRNPGDGTADVILVNPNGRSDRYVFNAGTYTRPSGVTTQLVKNATGPNAYTATLLDQTAWNFDVGGRLTSIVDRYGNQSVLAYSATGRLVSVSDPAGRGSLALAYDPTSGLLTSVTDWSGRKVSYDYDTSGRLFHVADRNNQRTTFAYDGTSQRLTSITDANGHVAVSMTYDPQGRVATQKDARGLIAGQQTSFSYGAPDAQGNVTTTVTYPATSSDGFAPQQLDTYNPQSQIVTHVFKPSATESLTATYTYDANGFRKQVTDARGNTTSFCYDTDYTGAAVAGSHGNLTRVIAPPPAAGGNPLVTLVKFDAKNNVVETVAPRGVNAGVGTTCATNLSAAVNTLFATDLTYDTSLGTELLSVTRKYTDPDLGQQTATTKFAYGDTANPGLVTQVTPPRGNTGAGPDTTFSTTLSYFGPGSQAGLLQSVTDPLGNKTTYAYDAVGRRTSLVDPLNNTWSFSYDNEDRLLSASAPAPVTGGAALTTQAQFDPVGNRITLTDANGQITRYLYDERDSLKQVDQSATVTDPNADPSKISAAYQYDNLGNLVRVDRATGSASEAVVDYAYDGLNRVRKETQYPQAGWPATPNGSTGSPTLLTQTTYDPNSNRQTLSDPQAQLTTFGYDTLNRLTSMAFTNAAPGTSATANVSYAYDANGNRTSLTDGTGSTSYTYDERDRLLSVTSPGPQTVGSRYDLDGNRTRVIYPDATAVTYTFDKASRLQSLADWVGRTTSYTYFADGLLNTSTNFNATTAQFSYDNARRLTQVTNLQTSTTPSSLISQHAYTLDAVGNRTHLDEQAPFIKVPIIPPCVGGCPPFALDPGAATQADDQAELQTASLAAMPLDQTASSPAAGAAPSAQRPLPLVDQSQDSSRTYQLRAEPAAYPGRAVQQDQRPSRRAPAAPGQRHQPRLCAARQHDRAHHPGNCRHRPGNYRTHTGHHRQRPGRQRHRALDRLPPRPEGGCGLTRSATGRSDRFCGSDQRPERGPRRSRRLPCPG